MFIMLFKWVNFTFIQRLAELLLRLLHNYCTVGVASSGNSSLS